jgi:hypothetical protein
MFSQKKELRSNYLGKWWMTAVYHSVSYCLRNMQKLKVDFYMKIVALNEIYNFVVLLSFIRLQTLRCLKIWYKLAVIYWTLGVCHRKKTYFFHAEIHMKILAVKRLCILLLVMCSKLSMGNILPHLFVSNENTSPFGGKNLTVHLAINRDKTSILHTPYILL